MRLYNLLLLSLLFLSYSLSAQDAKFVLRKAHEKCQSIQGGYFESKQYQKLMNKKDTVETNYKVYYKKLAGDSLADCIFHYNDCTAQNCYQEWMYTGSEYVWISHQDSTATLYNNNLWPNYVKRTSKFKCFSPITHSNSYPIPDSADLHSSNEIITLLGEQDILNQPCYHIRLDLMQSTSKSAALKPINQTYEYWIRLVDFLPVQYTMDIDIAVKGDTLHEFQKFVLTKHQLDNKPDERQLTLASIPGSYNLKDYSPADKGPQGLAIGEIAPDWYLLSLKNEKVKLNDLRGKVVLLQFFYKDSPGFALSIPGLQNLYKKYKNRGLEVFGIDILNIEPGLEEYIAKRKVEYPILLGSKETVKPYNLVYYPTFYVVDKDGKIRAYKDGYNNKTIDELEEIIKRNL